jgi:hypothetical protein
MTTGSAGEPLEEDCFSKEIIMKAWMAAAAAVITLASGAAHAGDVNWTVTVGSARPAPRVIYAPPAVVYHPVPVVYQPVYQPVPVVYSAAPVYRVVPHGHAKHWRKHAYHQGYRHGHHHDRLHD